MKKSVVFFAITLTLLIIPLSALYSKQSEKPMKYWTTEKMNIIIEIQKQANFSKQSGPSDRREGVMDSSKIRTVFYNYGSIGRPNTEPSMEWPKQSTHGYANEFGPIIGAEVVDTHGDTIPVFSEALIDGGDRADDGKVLGWQPLPGYLGLNNTPAMSNNRNSWPQTPDSTNPFFNKNYTNLNNRFLWPGTNGLGELSGSLEAYWVMDDRDNDEFEYYPFENDSSRRGLGLELTCRLIQYSDSVAEDIIIYIMEIKNVSDKRLDKVVAGMFSDTNIGGFGDFGDDFAGFDIDANMVYSWDKEGSGNDYNLPWDQLGWLGFKFLESPIGEDGNELGLTSITAPEYGTSNGTPERDDLMWEQLLPGLFDEANINQESDNVLIFGTGYFSLDPGESQHFSVAILMGNGLEDLYANGQYAELISDNNYQVTNIGNNFVEKSPLGFELSQNYPNPFNPGTTIKYHLKTKTNVRLTIYDITGREIKTLVNSNQNAGQHSVTFGASDLASGIYIYKLEAGTFEQARKMILLK